MDDMTRNKESELHSHGSDFFDNRGFALFTLKKDESGLTHIIEFTLALIIFLIILAGYFTAVNTTLILDEPTDSRRDDICFRYSELLISDTGFATTSSGNTTHWENLTPEEIDKNLTRPGLALEGNNSGILSMSKITGLRNVTFTKFLDLFAFNGYYFNFEINYLNGSKLIEFGYNEKGSHEVSRLERVVVIKENLSSKGTPAKLKFRVFDRVSRRQLVRINELMYHPEDGKHEWIELHNPSDEAVDLKNLAFYTHGGVTTRDLVQGDSTILPGKGYAIISDHNTVLSEYNISSSALRLELTQGNFARGELNDEGYDISISGDEYSTQYLSYNNTVGGNGNGKSIEWSLQDNVWKESADKGGTPGYENSVQ